MKQYRATFKAAILLYPRPSTTRSLMMAAQTTLQTYKCNTAMEQKDSREKNAATAQAQAAQVPNISECFHIIAKSTQSPQLTQSSVSRTQATHSVLGAHAYPMEKLRA